MMSNVFSIFDMLVEDDVLHTALHQSPGMHIHCVAHRLIDKALLHLGDVYHLSLGEFLKLGIVDIRPVQCDDVTAGVVGRAQHEAVAGGCRGEAYVRRNALVGVDVGMDLDTSLLLPRLGMPAHPLEDEVGEQRDGRGVDDLQTLEPCRYLPASAVRGKLILVGGIQITVYGPKDNLPPDGR